MKDVFKFDLGDRVFIKSQNVEGIIVGKRSSREALTIDYEVYYEVYYEYGCWEDHMYMGKKNTYIRVLEKDLLSLDEGHCDDQFAGYRFDDEFPIESKHYILYSGDCIDAINYSVNGIKVDILSTDSSETISMKVKLSVAAHMNSIPLVIDIPSCDHQWLPYEGLTQRFEYCKHCDAKK